MAVYFVPTLIAFGRKKRNTAAIFALNFFLGWTLLGWVLALVWSLSLDPPLPPARIS
ncbi:MAG: superinfection immunity protein [Proteobacteria bacterium]|nr:superinfection immunity protein [Pseudomonadota bacterium]